MKETKRYFIQQFQLMVQQKGFIFSLFFLLGLMLVSYLNCIVNMAGVDRFQSLSWECQCILTADNNASLHNIFLIAFPFVVLFPFSFSLFKDKKIKMRDIYLSRVSSGKYYVVKACVCFCGAFLVVFVPLCINILMCYVTFDGKHMTLYGEPGYFTQGYISLLKRTIPWAGMYVSHRLLYYIVWAVLVSALGGVFSLFALGISTFVKKYMVFLLLPGYMLIELLERLQFGQLSMDLNDYISIGFLFGREIWFLLLVVVVMLLTAGVGLCVDRKKEII